MASPFAVTVDLVVLTIQAGRLAVLLVERGRNPYQGQLALPGGFVNIDEGLETAAARELREETGISSGRFHLEQLRTYGDPSRDPRQRVVTVAYLALVADLPLPAAGSDAADARIESLEDVDLRALAFDHEQILGDGIERARAKLEYTTLATTFCPEPFTVAEVRRVYEAVWGVEIDPRNFHRKVLASEGFVEPTGDATTRGGGRPAQLYRAGPASALHPPLVRASTSG